MEAYVGREHERMCLAPDTFRRVKVTNAWPGTLLDRTLREWSRRKGWRDVQCSKVLYECLPVQRDGQWYLEFSPCPARQPITDKACNV